MQTALPLRGIDDTAVSPEIVALHKADLHVHAETDARRRNVKRKA